MKIQPSSQHLLKKNPCGLLSKPHCLVIITATLITQPVHAGKADATELPSASQSLIDRLAEYEQREQEKLEKTLNKKRNEVLVILRKHFAFRTKNGQLDQALAIRKEINRIEGLLPKPPPQRLLAIRKKFEESGKILPKSKVPPYFEIDADEKEGTIFLQFEHPQLEHMLEKNNRVELELIIDKNPGAGSVSSIIVKHGLKIIGQHAKPKNGETVKIRLDMWKIVRPGRSITLTIENSGKDRIRFKTDSKEDFAALLFSKR